MCDEISLPSMPKPRQTSLTATKSFVARFPSFLGEWLVWGNIPSDYAPAGSGYNLSFMLDATLATKPTAAARGLGRDEIHKALAEWRKLGAA